MTRPQLEWPFASATPRIVSGIAEAGAISLESASTINNFSANAWIYTASESACGEHYARSFVPVRKNGAITAGFSYAPKQPHVGQPTYAPRVHAPDDAA
jgi:hypothetical protein